MLHKIFLDGVERRGGLLLQNTRLGWVVSGPSDDAQPSSVRVFMTNSYVNPEPSQVISDGLVEQLESNLLRFRDLPITRADVPAVEEDEEFSEKLYRTKFSRNAKRPGRDSDNVEVGRLEDGQIRQQ